MLSRHVALLVIADAGVLQLYAEDNLNIVVDKEPAAGDDHVDTEDVFWPVGDQGTISALTRNTIYELHRVGVIWNRPIVNPSLKG